LGHVLLPLSDADILRSGGGRFSATFAAPAQRPRSGDLPVLRHDEPGHPPGPAIFAPFQRWRSRLRG